MRHRPLILVLVLALAGASGELAHADTFAASAPAADGHGVRLVARGRPAHLVVLLSPKRYRQVAGNTLRMICAPAPQTTLVGGIFVAPPREDVRDPAPPRGGRSAVLHPPHRRGPIATPIEPGWDWCTLTVRTVRDHGRSIARTGFATVGLTPAGTAFLDERRAAARVIVTQFFISLRPERWKRWARLTHAVVLASPEQTPPPGRLGLYSDGGRHVYAAEIDRAGDLLFLERDGDVTRTNLLRYLRDDSLLGGISGADLFA